MAYCLQQMCLAKADAPVEEQWVIGAARPLGHRHGNGVSHTVGWTDHEVFESVARVHSRSLAHRHLDPRNVYLPLSIGIRLAIGGQVVHPVVTHFSAV